MILLFEISDPAALESIPINESIGLLAVAVVLVAGAIGLRALISRWEKQKSEKEALSLAGKQNG